VKCQPVEFLDFVEDDLRHAHASYDSWQHEGARRFQERFRETIDWAIEPKVTTVVAVLDMRRDPRTIRRLLKTRHEK